MNFGCAEGGGGGGHNDQDSGGGEDGFKRKWNDLEASMKAMKDAVVKENVEKSAKIRRLMEEKEELNLLLLQKLPCQGPGRIRSKARPDPFDVFPPEVWKVIIEKITRYSDLEIFCLAFPQLEQMVKSVKTTIFLFETAIPLISKHLGWKDIINCRLVCNKWNQDLCAFLENSNAPKAYYTTSHSALTTSKHPVSYRDPSLKYFHAYSFDNPTKIQRFVEKMSGHPGNPFFGRFLRFDFTCEYDNHTELHNFWKSALQLVEKFGEHIWKIEITYCAYLYLTDFYKTIQQLLVYLPNLRDLQVKYLLYDFAKIEADKISAGQFWKSPLPPLPYLQSLKLDLCTETGMIDAFIPYFSNQIHHLELFGETLDSILKPESLRGLINLEYLEVEFELKSQKDILRLLEFPTANLKTLCLHTSYYRGRYRKPPDADSLSSEQFASLSEKFSRLEHLDLTNCRTELSSFLGSRIRFSGLKTLEIEVGIDKDDIHYNLDFILELFSLKHLVIVILTVRGRTDIDELDKHSALKLRKYLYGGDILETNIWTLRPSLQLLESMCKYHTPSGEFPKGRGIYTREMYENRAD